MPSPFFNSVQAETSRPLTLTPGAKRLFRAMHKAHNTSADSTEDQPKIKVSDLISKMAFYYEKIRNSVDYREEYLLRKGAIVRILKRQMVIEGVWSGQKEEDPAKLAITLLVELIRAGYLSNNTLPESKADEVTVILARYLTLKKRAVSYLVNNRQFAGKSFKNLQDETEARNFINHWLIGVAASEIEDNLSQNNVTDALVGEMFNVLRRSIELPSDSPFEEDLPIQLYLSICRNFLKLNDDDVLSFILFRYYYPNWTEADETLVNRVAEGLSDLRLAITAQINHPLSAPINKIAAKYTVCFTMLKDVLNEDPEGVYNDIINDPRSFARRVKAVCEKHYSVAKKKLWQSAVRSIIYIFLTKSVFVFVLEAPAIRLFGETLNYWSLAINISFPAALLFFAVALTRLPNEANTEIIVKGVEEIMFEEKARKQPFILRSPSQRHPAINFVFTVIYAATFLLSFGVVVWFLDKIHFSWVSTTIFLFFLAFAGFFAVRVRRGIKSFVVIEPKESIFTFLWSFFYIPVISTGQWLTARFRSINVFVFILDFIIEAPFKIFVGVAEEWTKYIKERKEGIN